MPTPRILAFAVLLLAFASTAAAQPPADAPDDTAEDTTDEGATDEGAADEGAAEGEGALEVVAPYEPPPPPEPAPPAEPVAEAQVADGNDAVEEEETDDEGGLLSLKASMFSRYELRSGYDDVGRPAMERDSVNFRARFGLVTSPLSIGEDLDVVLRLVPQATGTWELAGLTDHALGLHEGVLELHAGDLRFEAGRFEMTYGEHLLIGNVGWHPTGRSFDGMRLRLATGAENAWLDFFFTAVAEGSPFFAGEPGRPADHVGAGDGYFTGFYGSFGPHIAEKLALDGYVLAQIAPSTTIQVPDPMDPTMTIPEDQEAGMRFTVGSRFKHRFGLIDLRLEAGVQVGSDVVPAMVASRSILAYQVDLEVGVNLVDDRLRFALEAFHASGDDASTADSDEGWDQLYPTAHKWLGFADIIGFPGGLNGGGRSNLMGGVLHATFAATDKLELQLHGHVFMRPEERMNTVTMELVDGFAAAEVDVGAGYALGTGLAARVGYSIFLPQEDYYGISDPAHFLELELSYTQ